MESEQRMTVTMELVVTRKDGSVEIHDGNIRHLDEASLKRLVADANDA